MGKFSSISSTTRLQGFATATRNLKPSKPTFQTQGEKWSSMNTETTSTEIEEKISSSSSSSGGASNGIRVPLSAVVSDCAKRWFKDTLKEAKSGDISMQVLVGQMYYSGYGVTRDAQRGRLWMSRASRIRSSVWKVSDKHPGYNASDSDSDEMKNDS